MARAPTHTGTAVSPSRQRLDEVRGSSAVWTAVRPDNQRGVPSRAGEVRAHWPWVLARRARAGHLFLTIPHPCLPLHPPSPNNLEYLLAVSKNLAHPLHPVYEDGKGGGWKWWEWQISIAGATSDMYRCDVSVVATALYRSVMPNGNRPVLARPLPSGKKQRKTSLCSQKRSPMLRLLTNLIFLPVEYFSDAGGGGAGLGISNPPPPPPL